MMLQPGQVLEGSAEPRQSSESADVVEKSKGLEAWCRWSPEGEVRGKTGTTKWLLQCRTKNIFHQTPTRF